MPVKLLRDSVQQAFLGPLGSFFGGAKGNMCRRKFIILGKLLSALDQRAGGQRAVLWANQKPAPGGRGKGHSKL